MQCTKHNNVLCGIPQFYDILFYNNIVKLYMVDVSLTVEVGI